MKKTIPALAALIMLYSAANAQLTISGELRPRFEYRRGYKNILLENQEDAIILSQRTRLGVSYTLPSVNFSISMQDVRIWGDDENVTSSGVFGSASSIDLNEAWMSISLSKKSSLILGRQYWQIDDERMIAKRSWSQSEIKYDGMAFRFRSEEIEIDAGASWNNNIEHIYGNEFPANRMRTLDFIHLKRTLNQWIALSGVAILSGFTKSDTVSQLNLLGTYGLYAYSAWNNWKVTASGYYQHGKSRKGLEASAYFLGIKGEYIARNIKVMAGTDLLSGSDGRRNDPGYSNKEHVFDILYGARHRYLGNLDFFSDPRKATASGGLIDLYTGLNWRVEQAFELNLDLHYFWLQNKVIDLASAESGTVFLQPALGPEVDFSFSWNFLEILNLKGGYSVMFPTVSMQTLQGTGGSDSKTPQWFWLMLTAKPVFLNTARK